MSIEKKLLGISPSGGSAADVAEVFSTYLYTGNGSTQTITNGIDLAGEGGLVWIKNRNASSGDHWIFDTERGVGRGLITHSTSGQTSVNNNSLKTFNSNGFYLGDYAGVNTTSDMVSWTFRKKEKFFDVVTYTGNYTAGRTVSHSLGSVPAMIIVKCTSGAEDWAVYHQGSNGGTNPENYKLILNNTSAAASGYWNSTAPTDSSFTVSGHGEVNGNGATYVAYLFADNSSEDADDQMIKCGSYTTDGSEEATITLGWEPQFILVKRSDSSAGGDWRIIDTMRGTAVGGSDYYLEPNTSDVEAETSNVYTVTPTGFTQDNFGASRTYIYMAIRAPMMVEPEVGTDVFAVKSYTGIGGNRTLDAAFGPVDMAIAKRLADSSAAINLTTRLTSKEFSTNVGDPEGSFNFVNLESNSLVVPGSYFSNSSGIPYGLWAWKRAKGFFDVVAYDGTDTYRWQSHSLGAVPEMIWVKGRTADVSWAVYHKDVGSSKYLMLNDDAGQISSSSRWGGSDPTDSLFRLGSSSMVNAASDTYVAYLFTTLDGISKCGSYVGNGTNQIISCGFSSGSRYVLIKPSSTSGAWYLWDSARGIVAGGDPHLMLHTTAGQITGDDSVDPHNSGFKVNQIANTGINVSSTTYIFYAIA